MYETSIAPERIPSGGGFSLKNMSLLTLWSEHENLRNIWTKSNVDLPLVRYTGLKLKLYQSERLDYIFSWDNQLPLRSNMDMYHTMHPGVHALLKNKIIMPSKQTNSRRKPYTKIKIKPPTMILNKWHFQSDLSKTPLVQFRTSSASLQQYYINNKSISTTLTIPFLNASLIENTDFQHSNPNGWWAKEWGTQKIFLYGLKTPLLQQTKLNTLTLLANTQTNQPGQPPTSPIDEHSYTHPKWGNPFWKDYLLRNWHVYQSNLQPSGFISKLQAKWDISVSEVAGTYNFTEVFLTDAIRYNPYNDTGENCEIYFKSVAKQDNKWEPPQNPDLRSGGHPLWVLSFGFADFQKHLGKLQHIDTDHIIVLKFKKQEPPHYRIMPILSQDFINGNSPYEKGVNSEDKLRWHPSFQYQTQTLNNIALAGPGSPKIPTLETGQIIANYCFYFKWGGHPPPMSNIEDPRNEPTYPVPNNFFETNSLQNPATAPENVLYSFDQRRHYITKTALRRLQKDWDTKETTFTDARGKHVPEIETQQETSSEETTSEEEEETQNLLLKLQQQRHKHKQLKQRILQRLAKLQ